MKTQKLHPDYEPVGRGYDNLVWYRCIIYVRKYFGKQYYKRGGIVSRNGWLFRTTGTDRPSEAKVERDRLLSLVSISKSKFNLRMTMHELYYQFFDQKQADISNRRSLNNHYKYPWFAEIYRIGDAPVALKDLVGDKFIDEFGPGDWDFVVKEVRSHHPRRQMFDYHTLLNGMIQFALRKKYLSEDPSITLDRKKEKQPERAPWEKRDVEKFLKNSEGVFYKFLFMMKSRGLRPFVECRLLQKKFFDFETGMVRLPGHSIIGGVERNYTKTGKPRSFPMGPLKTDFRAWCDDSPNHYIFFDTKNPIGPVSETWVRRQWEALRESLGYGTEGDTGLYRFRHFSIVQMLTAGIDIKSVASWHGTSIRKIEENYSNYLPENVRVAATRLEAIDAR